MDPADDGIDLHDAIHALAIMGDLSMGQPIDHSLRVACLSAALARHRGMDVRTVAHVQHIALLRWSGCTANASEIAATITDDISGRAAMLALQFDKIEFVVSPASIAGQIALTSTIHCEVSGLIAQALGLDAAVQRALDCVFEHWDGSGSPRGLLGDAIPAAALVVSVCSELEVLSRSHGLPGALNMLRQRAGVVYPESMVDCLIAHAARWLSAVPSTFLVADQTGMPYARRQVPMDVLGHVIDLKLPWLTGHSRAVASLSDSVAASMGLAPGRRAMLRRAAWLHGLGRVAIPNSVWNRASTLTTGEWERVRLAPYWTSRAAKHIAGLADAADLASHAYERLDGSGYFRGTGAVGASLERRILAPCIAWVAMRADRPWRDALSATAVLRMLRAEGNGAGFDAQVLEVLAHCVLPQQAPSVTKAMCSPVLSARECEVLRRISLGDSNKAAAQQLGISPSTVRTHLENVFKKLGCNTRAACTLRALLLGLLD